MEIDQEAELMLVNWDMELDTVQGKVAELEKWNNLLEHKLQLKNMELDIVQGKLAELEKQNNLLEHKLRIKNMELEGKNDL